MKKVYVAMSGGVDSSVAAALLKQQGYDVTGVFMKFWSPDENSFCIWKEERADAARVAAKLGISLLTWDFTQEYEKKVVAYMLEAYKSGITPNPDIMCNKEIKFGMFFDKAIRDGADYVATGHYARIKRIKNHELRIKDREYKTLIHDSEFLIPEYGLYQAADRNKDQSYFLYTLEQRHLERTLFPIGEYTKPEVRELAKKFDLPTAEKKDSQGVCFIGPLKMKSFLKDYIKPKKGKVFLVGRKVSEVGREKDAKRQTPNANKVLGFHDGAFYYTIGQRHGIDLKLAGGPYYVIGKNVEKNEIYVGSEDDLYSDEAVVSSVHWIGEVPNLPAKIGVKIRYRSETVPASISYQNNKSSLPSTFYLLRFDMPVRAITPGQAAVFYEDEKVLGGGIIK